VALCLQVRHPRVRRLACGVLTRLVRGTLQKDPKKRPTALALQQHKFVLTAKKPVRG
jgi:hypothetical protein